MQASVAYWLLTHDIVKSYLLSACLMKHTTVPQLSTCVQSSSPAACLQLRGCSVCIVERRRVEGRSQEWNISRHELQVTDVPLDRKVPVWLSQRGYLLCLLQDCLPTAANQTLLLTLYEEPSENMAACAGPVGHAARDC